jgi:transcription initiation factor TFIIB
MQSTKKILTKIKQTELNELNTKTNCSVDDGTVFLGKLNTLHFHDDFRKMKNIESNNPLKKKFYQFRNNEEDKELFDKLMASDPDEYNDLCELCDKNSIIEKDGFMVCISCGIAFEMIMDDTQEWRWYGVDDNKFSDPTRCGMPTNDLLPLSSLGSSVASFGASSYKMRKIRKYQHWNSMPYREKILYDCFDTINLRSINGCLSTCIIEEAKNIYGKVSSYSMCRGMNKLALQASCVMAACKLKKVPRNCGEIAKMFNLSISDMRKGAKRFEEIWKQVEKKEGHKDKLNLYSTNPEDYLRRFCSKLELSDEICDMCTELCKIVESKGVMDTHISISRAAGIIYFVANNCGVNISRDDILKHCDISQVTIGKCFNELTDFFGSSLGVET